MDLKTFVAESLTQIVEGVQDAQKRIAEGDSGAAINPTRIESESSQTHAEPRAVEFDVAVLVSDEAGQAGGEKLGASVGLISVLTARAAAEVQDHNSASQRHETASRIKFTVMLAQPAAISRRQRVAIPTQRVV